MLDIRLIRDHPEEVKKGVALKAGNPAFVDDARRLDEQRRGFLQKTESLKSTRNTVSNRIAAMKAKKEDATAVIAEMKSVSDEIKGIDEQLREVEQKLHETLLQIPNIPHASVPVGKTPAENQVIAAWGDEEERDFTPKAHWEIAEHLGIIDFVRGTKITGAGFPV
jgi:seryl-tRNA synthetase